MPTVQHAQFVVLTTLANIAELFAKLRGPVVIKKYRSLHPDVTTGLNDVLAKTAILAAGQILYSSASDAGALEGMESSKFPLDISRELLVEGYGGIDEETENIAKEESDEIPSFLKMMLVNVAGDKAFKEAELLFGGLEEVDIDLGAGLHISSKEKCEGCPAEGCPIRFAGTSPSESRAPIVH